MIEFYDSEYIIGVDPAGQGRDRTVVSIAHLEANNVIRITHCFMLPDDTTFAERTTMIVNIARRFEPKMVLVIDKTGLGSSIVEDVRAEVPFTVGLQITCGVSETMNGNDYTVSKSLLVASLAYRVGNQLIKIDKSCDNVDVIREEFTAFSFQRKTIQGGESYGASSGKHDDIVMSLAYCSFLADKVAAVAKLYAPFVPSFTGNVQEHPWRASSGSYTFGFR